MYIKSAEIKSGVQFVTVSSAACSFAKYWPSVICLAVSVPFTVFWARPFDSLHGDSADCCNITVPALHLHSACCPA